MYATTSLIAFSSTPWRAHRRETSRAKSCSPGSPRSQWCRRSKAACFCTGVQQTSDLDGGVATSERMWDSCMLGSFAKVAGDESFRSRPKDRYRQWLTHKFATWVDQFGTFGCVGCGRCIAWCPAGIDVREELNAIAPPATAPVAVVAGILAAAGVMVGLPDWLRWLTAIGAGGAVATAGHALNAVGRAKTGAASGGIGNPVYATAELGGSVLLAALALLVPVVALVAIVVLVAWALKRRRRRPV